MNTRSEWRNSTNLQSYYTVEETINDVIENFNIRRYQSAEGYSVKIDNIEIQVIIQSHSNPLNEGKYDRKIHMPIETVVQTGSMVEWKNEKWLVTSSIDDKQAYKTASIVKCTNTIQLYKSGVLYRIPCVVSNTVYGSDTEDTKYLSTVAGQIIVQVPNNEITREYIKPNDIFKIGNFSYKCLQPNDIVKQGLLVIPMNYSDVEQVLPTFSIKILNTNVSTIIGTPIQLQTEVYDGINTSPLSSTPQLIFESSDTSIVTVDNNSLVTPISVGTTTITCKLGFDETISSSVNINVVSVPVQETYYLELTGDIPIDTEIKVNQTKVYTCVKKNSKGEVVSGAEFDFIYNADGVAPTSKYIFTIISSTQCSIKCLGSTYYTKLKAIDLSDSTTFKEKDIKLRSVM